MEGDTKSRFVDDLLGDTAVSAHIHRERDSLDDFEHLDRDSSPNKDEKSFSPDKPAFRAATPEETAFGTQTNTVKDELRSMQTFLDTEREELMVEPSRLPPPLVPATAPASEPVLREPTPEPILRDTTSEPLLRKPSPEPARPRGPTPEAVFADSREDLSDDEPEPIIAKQTPVVTPPVVAPTPSPPVTPVPAPVVPPHAVAAAKISSPVATHVPDLFKDLGLDTLLGHPEKLHPKVEALLYWRSPTKSGIALGGGLLVLLALANCSLISVLAYTALLTLTGTIVFRLYKSILQAVQKTSDGNPFKDVLEADLTISPEKAQETAVLVTAHVNAAVTELRRLFLVEDLVDSLKFAVMLWCLTYVGAWFNGMTIIIIVYVALFTLPKGYEANKTQIDANIEIVQAKLQELTNKVRAAIPIGKKADSDKDK